MVSKILYLILAEKMVVCCFVVVLLFMFRCLLQLCPILAYFFLIEALNHRAEKNALKEKIIRCTVWEGKR